MTDADLVRFLDAQSDVYEEVTKELTEGRKLRKPVLDLSDIDRGLRTSVLIMIVSMLSAHGRLICSARA